MAQLYYRWGQMNSSKSAQLLQVAHNYEETGRNVLLLTSSVADRDGYGVIRSRAINEERRADVIVGEDTNITARISQAIKEGKIIDCILAEECQFYKEKHIKELRLIVNILNIPVICYGLKTDSNYNLFEGSEALFRFADKIEEIKTVCWYCGSKATAILRFDEAGNVVKDGAQVHVGGNDTYKSVCSPCWFAGGERHTHHTLT